MKRQAEEGVEELEMMKIEQIFQGLEKTNKIKMLRTLMRKERIIHIHGYTYGIQDMNNYKSINAVTADVRSILMTSVASPEKSKSLSIFYNLIVERTKFMRLDDRAQHLSPKVLFLSTRSMVEFKSIQTNEDKIFLAKFLRDYVTNLKLTIFFLRVITSKGIYGIGIDLAFFMNNWYYPKVMAMLYILGYIEIYEYSAIKDEVNGEAISKFHNEVKMAFYGSEEVPIDVDADGNFTKIDAEGNVTKHNKWEMLKKAFPEMVVEFVPNKPEN